MSLFLQLRYLCVSWNSKYHPFSIFEKTFLIQCGLLFYFSIVSQNDTVIYLILDNIIYFLYGVWYQRCCQEGFQASTETLRCPVFWRTAHCTCYTHSSVHYIMLYTTQIIKLNILYSIKLWQLHSVFCSCLYLFLLDKKNLVNKQRMYILTVAIQG